MAYVITDYLDVQGIEVSPPDTWYVGLNSIDSGNNYYVFFLGLPTFNVVEGLTITESSTSFVIANSYHIEPSATNGIVLNGPITSTNPNATGITNFSGYASSAGVTFVSNKTGRLGKVIAGMRRAGTLTGLQPATIELWQLTSNSILGTPNTLLASTTFNQNVIPTSNTSIVEFNLSNVTGADVVAGTGYALVFKAGADWTTSSNYLAIRDERDTTIPLYNHFINSQRLIYKASGGSWTVTSDQIAIISIETQSTTSDTDVGILDTTVLISETGTTAESSDRTIQVLRYSDESSAGQKAAAALVLKASAGFGGGAMNSTYGSGIGFIAPRSGRLGDIRSLYSKVNNNTPPTSAGSLELWQLASNSITASASVKLAEVPIYWNNAVTTAHTPILVGSFSNVVGADVVAGNAYAVVVRVGADWSSSTNTYNFWGVDYPSNSYFMNSLYGLYSTQSVVGPLNGSNGSNTTRIPVMDVEYQTTNTDIQTNIITTDTTVTENGTSTESSVRDITAIGRTSEGAFINVLGQLIFTSNTNFSTGASITFIAQKTGAIAHIAWPNFYAGSNAVSNGNVLIRLYNATYATNTIGSLISTKTIPVVTGQSYTDAFSYGVNLINHAFNVTAGQAYIITLSWDVANLFGAGLSAAYTNNATSYYKQYQGNLTNTIIFMEDEAAREALTGSFIASTDVSETGTSTDNIAVNKVHQLARGDEAPGGLLVFANGNSGSSGSTGETYVGVKFIATQTTQVGDIYGGFYRAPIGNTPSTDLGTLELWQLSSNSITAPVQTKIAEVPFDLRDVSTTSNRLNYMGSFNSNSNAIVTQGNAYAVIFVQAATWNTTTTQRLWDNSILDSSALRSLPYTYILGSTRDSVLSSLQSGKAFKIEPAFKNAQESSINILNANSDLTETGASTDTLSSLKHANNYVVEYNNVLGSPKVVYTLTPSIITQINSAFPKGSRFIAQNSGTIKTVQVYGATTADVADGTFDIQIWQLASNTASAYPQTLIGTATVSYTQLNRSGTTQRASLLDVSSANISITAGTYYALVFTNPTFSAGTYSVSVQEGLNSAATDYNYNRLAGILDDMISFNGSVWQGSTKQIIPFNINLTDNTNDTLASVFSAPVNLTETGTLSDLVDRIYFAAGNITETGTSTDDQFNITLFTSSITETGTGLDVITSDRSALALELEGPAVVHITHNTTDAQNANSKSFLGFIYTPTTNVPLSTISLLLRQFNTAGATPTQPCTVELWQGVVSNQPQTLLKSVPYFIDTITTSVSGARYEFDFSGITLQAGQQYVIGHRVGSDVTISTKYPLIGVTTVNSGITNYLETLYPVIYKDFFASGSYQSRNNFGSLIAARVNKFGIIDDVNGGFTTNTNISEKSNQNYIQYPLYDSSAWTNAFPAGATLTTGISDPLGGNTAVRLSGTNTADALLRVSFPTFTANGTDKYTFSFYVRKVSGTTAAGNILSADVNDTPEYNYFNDLVSNTWVRVTYTDILPAGSKSWLDVLSNRTTDYVLDFWGASVEPGTVATPIVLPETITNYITFEKAVTETGTTADTQFNITSFTSAINETGTSVDIQSNIATLVTRALESTRKNLFNTPENLSNSSGTGWPQTNVTVTSDQTDPDGGTSAYLITEANAISTAKELRQSLNYSINGTYTVSIYAKANGRNQFRISVGTQSILFDISTQIASPGTGWSNGTITSVGSGWYRCSGTVTPTLYTGNSFNIWLTLCSGGVPTYTGDGVSGMYLWHPQFEEGSTLTSWSISNSIDTNLGALTAASSITETGSVSESLQSILTRIASLTETSSALAAQSSQVNFVSQINELLSTIEQQSTQTNFVSSITETSNSNDTISSVLTAVAKLFESTHKNLITSPENFTVTFPAWSSPTTTFILTPNASTDPLGGSNATKISGTSTSGGHSIYWNGYTNAYWVGINNAFSIYVKAAEYTKFQIADAGAGSFNATFDLTAVTSTAIKGCTASITSEGNGWYRCGIVIDANAGQTPATRVTFGGYPSTGATNINYGPQYTGDDVSGVYIWGAQLELNSSVTSYENTATIHTDIANYVAVTSLTESSIADSVNVSQINFVSSITESRTLLDSVTNNVNFVSSRNELLTALESSNNTTVFVTQLLEQVTSSETQSNLVSFVSSLSEVLNSSVSELSQVQFVSFADDALSANDEVFNIASRVAALTEQLFSVEFTETQVAFVSNLLESVNASENNFNILTTYQDVVETLIADDNISGLANFVSDILETIEAISLEDAVRITDALLSEVGLVLDETAGISTRIANLVEALEATDESTRLRFIHALINEIGLAEEQLGGFLLVALDWDTLVYQVATVEYSTAIAYMDDIEVFYENAPPKAEVTDDGMVDFRYIA